MSFEITGKLYRKFGTEVKSERFKAREFVLEIMDGSYAQMIKFQVVQERCETLDAFNEGEEIKVDFDLRGREWQGKFFSTLNAWRIQRAAGATAAPAPNAPTASNTSATPNQDYSFPSAPPVGGYSSPAPIAPAPDDDLPF